MNGAECNGESCCTSIAVPRGTFKMGRGTESCTNCTAGCPGGVTCNADETPEHDVTVSAFSLDKYEVTVGRFRRYVDAYDALGAPPPANSGAHPNIPGTGWQADWNGNLPADTATLQAAIQCQAPYYTWGKGNEQLPIGCASWHLALAFCIWDGGRLPTEAEWEYAAAGGDENRLYPWASSLAPSCSLANYSNCVSTNVAPVGSYASGQGRWGHLDLAGNLLEWTFDWYSDLWYSNTSATGTDVANVTPSSYRIFRGGSWGDYYDLRAARRTYDAVAPASYHAQLGLRCARSP